MQVIILEEAAKDIVDAHDWYESRRPGLGFDFEICIEAALDNISLFPESFPSQYRQTRRVLVSHFPYGVYFTIKNDAIYVLGVFHLKRSPGIIKSSVLRVIKKKV